MDEFRNRHANPFIEGLPPQHRSAVLAIFEDFVTGDLRKRLGSSLGSTEDQVAAVEKLHRLAVQREAVVTVVYDPTLATEWFDDTTRRVLVRVWDDEIVHEAYLCAVADELRGLGLQRWMGYQGGLSATVSAGGDARPARVIWGKAVRAGARTLRMMSKEVDPARVPRDLGAWSAYQAALELTAAVAYVVFANLLAGLPVAQPHLNLRTDRLSFKLLEIAKEELWHAELFAMICRRSSGTERAEDAEELAQAARIVRSASGWPAQSRLGHIRPRALGVDGADAVIQQVHPVLDSVDWSTVGGRQPCVVIACNASLSRRRLAQHLPLKAVVSDLANWCRANNFDGDLWVVSPSKPMAAVQSSGVVGTGMKALSLGSLAAINDASKAIMLADEVIAGGTMPLTSYGTFTESNPDVLHYVWDIWVLAALRVCLSSAELAFTTLGQVVHSQLDFVGGPDLDADVVVAHVPRLRDLAVLRLLGAYPPDIWVLWDEEGRVELGSNLVELGGVISAKSQTQFLSDAAWRVALLAAAAIGPDVGFDAEDGESAPGSAYQGASSPGQPRRPEPARILVDAPGPWSERELATAPSLVRLYRYRSGPGVDLDSLDGASLLENVDQATWESWIDEMVRLSGTAAEADADGYEVLYFEGRLHRRTWAFDDIDEIVARVEASLGSALNAQDCLEQGDRYIIITGDRRWRPLFSSAFVSSLYRLSRSRGG